ncbi:glycosyltransferase family 4 protein [Thermococcus alcaliphilus]|uniref:glycosyltransferase family 4 protein n=1 Tax=Thermococcus alcaliphilus TaxID=139207 RepID=UPI002091593A|nr:glycosyltransferase family 4 protein [Thermococcus alcaliphilus]MCO6042257.1 glycosyltransferase family 4 protein [Thermococcus alcaliphilus]
MELNSKMGHNRINLLVALGNFYDPERPSWPEVMGIFGTSFPNLGHKVYWIMPYHGKPWDKIKKESFEKKVEIYLIPLMLSRNSAIFFVSLLSYMFRLFKISVELVKNNDINFILIRDNPWAGIVSLFIKKFFNIPIAFNYSFPMYQGAVDEFKINRSFFNLIRLIYWKIWELLVLLVLRFCDLILPISREMANQLREKNLSHKKMFPLPLGVDPRVFRVSANREEVRKRLSIGLEDITFIYVGSITVTRGLSILLNTAAKLKNERFKILFVGDGNDVSNLKTLASKLGIEEKVIFTGRVPYMEVPNYINASDVGLSIIAPLKCYYVASPCKLFEYMSLAKPVIANSELPEHERVIRQSKGGYLVRYDPQSIADVMRKILTIHESDRIELTKMGLKGKRWVLNNRTFEKMARKLSRVMLDIIKECEYGPRRTLK